MRKDIQINPEGIPMNDAENDAELDRILSRSLSRNLSSNGEIVPSSGFAASVMERVQREAAMQAPEFASIPFPWSRALPGLVVCLLLAVGMMVSLMRTGVQAGQQLGMQASISTHLSLLAANFATNFATHVSADVSTRMTELLTEGLHHATQMGAGWVLLALLFSWVTVQFSLYLADA